MNLIFDMFQSIKNQNPWFALQHHEMMRKNLFRKACQENFSFNPKRGESLSLSFINQTRKSFMLKTTREGRHNCFMPVLKSTRKWHVGGGMGARGGGIEIYTYLPHKTTLHVRYTDSFTKYDSFLPWQLSNIKGKKSSSPSPHPHLPLVLPRVMMMKKEPSEWVEVKNLASAFQ